MSDKSSAFLHRWKTDVEPVHDKTERSREFRTGYWVMGLRTMFGMNAVALVAVPVVGKLLGVSFADHMVLFLRAEGSFLLGVAFMIVAILFSLITLDTDVIRQKGERATARQRLIDDEFSGYFEDSIESERVKSERHQRKYWRLGVGLFWSAVVLMLFAGLTFLKGCLVAGEMLATVAT